jgi:hypothetical protein
MCKQLLIPIFCVLFAFVVKSYDDDLGAEYDQFDDKDEPHTFDSDTDLSVQVAEYDTIIDPPCTSGQSQLYIASNADPNDYIFPEPSASTPHEFAYWECLLLEPVLKSRSYIIKALNLGDPFTIKINVYNRCGRDLENLNLIITIGSNPAYPEFVMPQSFIVGSIKYLENFEHEIHFVPKLIGPAVFPTEKHVNLINSRFLITSNEQRLPPFNFTLYPCKKPFSFPG